MGRKRKQLSNTEESEDSEQDNRKNFYCVFCSRPYENATDVEKHEINCPAVKRNTAKIIFTDKGERKFLCDICNSQIKFLKALKKHKTKHEPPGGYICKLCGERFCMENLLIEHRDTKHLVYKCRICESIFTDKDVYVDHIMTVHDGQDRQFVICEDCGEQFKTNSVLLMHRASNCGTTKPFKCEECGSHFRTKSILKNHKNIHKGEKKFCCSYCGESFVTNGQLKVHERMHTKEKPFVCNVCNKAFSHRESLVTHSTIHTGIKPYLCECCGSRFSCVSNILQHRRRRPDTCGLPQYCTQLSKAAPRPKQEKLMPKPVCCEPKKKEDVKIFKTFVVDEVKSKKNLNDENEIDVNNDDEDIQKTCDVATIDKDQERLNMKTELIEEISVPVLKVVDINDEFENVIEIKKDEENGKEKLQQSPVNEFVNVKVEEDTKSDNDDFYSNLKEYYSNFSENSNDNVIENKNNIKIQFQQSIDSENVNINAAILNRIKIEEKENTENYDDNDDDDDIPLAQLSNINESIKNQKQKLKKFSNSSKKRLKLVNKKDKSDFKNRIKTTSSELKQNVPAKFNKKTSKKTKKPNNIQNFIQDQLYECDLCPKVFKRKTPYIKHCINEHKQKLFDVEVQLQKKFNNLNENSLICKHCGKVYYSPLRLKAHEKLHGLDGKLLYKCSCCPKHFETQKLADEHARAEHKDKLTCVICKKIYSNLISLRVHRNYFHLPENEKKKIKKQHMCQKCGQKFLDKSRLHDHERSNCGKDPLYECELCHKKLHTFKSLKKHQDLHTGTLTFKCTYCDRLFRTKAETIVHERRHTGEKPFKCDFCPKAFAHRESLLTHVSLHTGVKRFLCNGCGERFTCISNLQAHRKAHLDSCGSLPLNTKSVTPVGYDHGVLYIGGKNKKEVD